MKLRNKKTGEVQDSEKLFSCYESLKELSEYWEDYTQSEPLIKDEKIRKAVRAWAEANKIDSNNYYATNVVFDQAEHRLTWINTSIEFNEPVCLEDGKEYTIAELCGEEEE